MKCGRRATFDISVRHAIAAWVDETDARCSCLEGPALTTDNLPPTTTKLYDRQATSI
jgi:hypothetical protein